MDTNERTPHTHGTNKSATSHGDGARVSRTQRVVFASKLAIAFERVMPASKREGATTPEFVGHTCQADRLPAIVTGGTPLPLTVARLTHILLPRTSGLVLEPTKSYSHVAVFEARSLARPVLSITLSSNCKRHL